MVNDAKISVQNIRSILDQISDPEIPVLTITDLGIIREIKITNSPLGDRGTINPPLGDGGIEVFITPTYTGCPAMDMIATNIRLALTKYGFPNETIKITTVLSPAWTTDWISEEGKEKLKKYGIAPPVGKAINEKNLEEIIVECPQCNSKNTRLISSFGSTACKALFQCNDCKEPFDYFKCH